MENIDILWDDPIDDFQLRSQFQVNTIVFTAVDEKINFYERLVQWFQPFIDHYPWCIEPPILRFETRVYKTDLGKEIRRDYVHGELGVGDHYKDEMLFIHLLVEFTKSSESTFFHVFSCHDGEILLIQGSEFLEDELRDHKLAVNRPWIHRGSVVVLNSHGSTRRLLLDRAIEQLKNRDFTTHERLSSTVRANLEESRNYNMEHVLDIELKLPPLIDKTIVSNPYLLAQTLELTYDEEGFDKIHDMIGGEAVKKKYAIQAKDLGLFLLIHKMEAPELDFVDFSTMIVVRAFSNLKGELRNSKLSDGENSRDTLQEILIKDNRLSGKIEGNYQAIEEVLSQDLEDVSELHEKEDVDNVIKRMQLLMEEGINIDEESDFDEVSDDEPRNEHDLVNEELEAILESDFKDFVDYLIEQKNGVPEYNDESDYEDGEGEIQGDMNYDEYIALRNGIRNGIKSVHDSEEEDGDVIIDVDSEEDIDPYDEPLDVKDKLKEYLKQTRHDT